jgi:glyoxylase-like metal-dependent hydrolase (beta-lactamase superfamily II)
MSEPEVNSQLDPDLARVPLKTPTLPPATRTNTYVVGQQRLCVVDPAPSQHQEQEALLAYLRARQEVGHRVEALVLTHHHLDHVGACGALLGELRVPVWAHPLTAERVSVPVAQFLEHGDALPCDGQPWTAVFTPGHAAGHLCFHRQADGVILAGDMVAGVGSILVDPDEGSMRDYLASLERLRHLSPTILYPAHGFPLTPGTDALTRYLHHRLARSMAVLERLRAGDRTPEAIVPRVYADTPPAMFGLAARSVMAMLIHHEQEGRARRALEEWYAV